MTDKNLKYSTVYDPDKDIDGVIESVKDNIVKIIWDRETFSTHSLSVLTEDPVNMYDFII